jgi:hypothetical protein
MFVFGYFIFRYFLGYFLENTLFQEVWYRLHRLYNRYV